jgi:hypothetical protein
MSFRLYQVYYKDDQLPKLYPFATPYKNEGLTKFFENSVIGELVPKCTADKVAICSHALDKKVGGGVPMRQPFTQDILETDFEVLCLGRKMPEHRMLFNLEQWHPGSRAILEKIFQKLGKQAPGEPRDAIYSNHFMAKTPIYQDYVSDLLIPAMNLMENDEEIYKLVNVDSNYYKLQPPYTEYAERVKKFLGTSYAPLHAFLCERLFSIWIRNTPIKVKYL